MVTPVRAFIIHELYIHEYMINNIYRSITSTLMFKGGMEGVLLYFFVYSSPSENAVLASLDLLENRLKHMKMAI